MKQKGFYSVDYYYLTGFPSKYILTIFFNLFCVSPNGLSQSEAGDNCCEVVFTFENLFLSLILCGECSDECILRVDLMGCELKTFYTCMVVVRSIITASMVINRGNRRVDRKTETLRNYRINNRISATKVPLGHLLLLSYRNNYKLNKHHPIYGLASLRPGVSGPPGAAPASPRLPLGVE